MNEHILIVEDDTPVRNLIITTLQTHQYHYLSAPNGQTALGMLSAQQPDIVLLDLGLPDYDGVDLIRKIRTFSQIPIIVISARSEDADKIEALDAGGDDYLTKPFSVEELLARIRATSRRLQYMSKDTKQDAVFDNGPLHIDYVSGIVSINAHPVHLTPIEYKLLCLLAQNIGRVLTYKYISTAIWGNDDLSNKTSLRVFMTTLRKKIETNQFSYIQTHIGVGYRMVKYE